MTTAPPPRPRADRLLLIEAGLVLLLLAAFLVLYVVPTQERLQGVPWWSPVLLAGLALAVLLVDSRRRKRRHQRNMDEMMEHHGGGRP